MFARLQFLVVRTDVDAKSSMLRPVRDFLSALE
jgi:hypothetical protein